MASRKFRRSSFMLSPCVAQPGIAGTSAQKPPSSASCTTILIFIFSTVHFPPGARQIQVYRLLRRLGVDFGGNLADGAGDLLGGLRAGDGVFLREQEGRHAGN